MDSKLSDLLHGGDGKYLLVNIVARRMRTLNQRAKVQGAAVNAKDNLDIIIDEMKKDKIRWVPKVQPAKLVDIVSKQQ